MNLDKFTPITFALAFVRAMRKRTDLSHIPSVRTTIALPRFLSARFHRTGQLTPKDYVEAAVYLTAPEDQGAAFEIARELLFPKDRSALPTPTSSQPTPESILATAGDVIAAAPQEEAPSVLDTLAGMNLDLASFDLAALDLALDEKSAAATELRSLDLITTLATSTDPAQQALAGLATELGGASALEAEGIADEPSARRFVLMQLLGGIGTLEPGTIASAGRAGFADALATDDATVWERAGLYAASGRTDDLVALLDDLVANRDGREIGRALRFVRAGGAPSVVRPFQVRALASARHLADWAEILDGLDAYVAPPQALVEQSVRDNPRGAFAAAARLDARDDRPDPDADLLDDPDAPPDADAPELRVAVFDAWADAHGDELPELAMLLELAVVTPRWTRLLERTFAAYLEAFRARVRATPEADRLEPIREGLALAPKLPRRQAGELATAALVTIGSAARFLPLLDAILDLRLAPHDATAVVAAGTALGIDEDQIYARLSQPLEQLKFLIEGNIQDLRRYLELVDKITYIPDELLDQLIAICVRDGNRMGLALLLAVALGPTLARIQTGALPAPLVDAALSYRGIGGGENLLLQWYEHRDHLPSEFKDRVRALAKAALLDAALAWAHAGVGGAERGLLPQSRTRAYRAGDELDLVDIDGTIESLAMSGKSLAQMSEEDLLVQDTASGRAGFGVLIDISGSMTGRDLAVCAIAVVMLLGRLLPEELALALFESDTHVVKGFASTRELDDVAGELLELRATGGTCVDAALTFIADEFAAQPELERRVMFLLSDFAFFESPAELVPHLDRLRELDVHFIGAGHGYIEKEVAALFVNRVGGQVTKIPSLAKLPELLLSALSWVSSER